MKHIPKHLLILASLASFSIASTPSSGVGGCRGAPPRTDARAIVRAYEDFQNASPTDRPAALRSLEAAPCTDNTTCADRDACVRYGRSLTRAQELARKARELGPVGKGGSGAATDEELAVIISAADSATREATEAEPLCRAALDRLYSLARK